MLLMNIPLFARPVAAYARPHLWGGDDGASLWTLLAQWVLFEGKTRALFSILFGAGILRSSSAPRPGAPASPWAASSPGACCG